MLTLFFGLGNYGKEYDDTRHNIGQDFLNYLNDSKWKSDKKRKYYIKNYADTITLIKNKGFINNSGETLKDFIDYVGDIHGLIVIHDDITIPLGTIINSFGGSSSHNGVKSINAIRDNPYTRIRLGIGRPDNGSVVDWVLGKFSKEELKKVDEMFIEAKSILENYL